MFQARKKKKAKGNVVKPVLDLATAQLVLRRERKQKRIAYVIIGLLIAAILIGSGVFYYLNYVAPFHRLVITIDDIQIRMDYFLDRCRIAEADPQDMLVTLTHEQLIKFGAPRVGITVTEQDIDQELRLMASASSDNTSDNTTITEAEFQEWCRQRLSATGLSDAKYRELVGNGLLVTRFQEYLAQQVPTAVESVHLHAIVVTTAEKAAQAADRIKAGESFDAVARDVSIDDESRQNGGDMGWVPRGVYFFDETAFSLNIGDISEPLPYTIDETSGPAAYFLIMVSEKSDSREIEPKYLETVHAIAVQNWLTQEAAQHEIVYHGFSAGGFDKVTYYWIEWQLAKAKTSLTASSSQ
jgi:hypothetical protein